MQTATVDNASSTAANGNAVDHGERRRMLEEAFATALSAGGVVPHYQPVVSLRSGNVAGWKSLARWDHPTRGLIGPGLFMQVFDNNDICMRLGEVMCGAICADMASWAAQGLSFSRVGLSASHADLKRANFADIVLASLDAHAIAHRHLVLQVPQSVLDDADNGELRRINDAGCLIALDLTDGDDLTGLDRFPCDIVKISRGMTSNIATSAPDRALIEKVVARARANGCSTVAEGIESRTQSDLLRELGCDKGNGYLYGRPQTPQEAAGGMVSLFTRQG